MAKLLGVTSYAIPAPPRMAHFPWPVGSYANPRRGAKFVYVRLRGAEEKAQGGIVRNSVDGLQIFGAARRYIRSGCRR